MPIFIQGFRHFTSSPRRVLFFMIIYSKKSKEKEEKRRSNIITALKIFSDSVTNYSSLYASFFFSSFLLYMHTEEMRSMFVRKKKLKKLNWEKPMSSHCLYCFFIFFCFHVLFYHQIIKLELKQELYLLNN